LLKPLNLAHTPTPIHRLNRISERWNGEIWIKRDDMTGAGLAGNKVRKLEYLLADAQAGKADTVITCGGVQSNHCRATALACAGLGLHCELLLRGDPPSEIEGNLLLDHLSGAGLHFIPGERYYDNLSGELARLATEVKARGGSPYIIPEGGSNAVGAWGYVEALRETRRQCRGLGLDPVRIVCATGSGGTHAGLLVGARLEGWDVEVVSITVSYDHDETVLRILEIADSMIDRYRLNIRVVRGDIHVIDDYIGDGYAKAGRDVLDVIAEMASCEGVVVDPVYTGKAALGIRGELAKDGMEGATLFWHTGGIYGLFAFRDAFFEKSEG